MPPRERTQTDIEEDMIARPVTLPDMIHGIEMQVARLRAVQRVLREEGALRHPTAEQRRQMRVCLETLRFLRRIGPHMPTIQKWLLNDRGF